MVEINKTLIKLIELQEALFVLQKNVLLNEKVTEDLSKVLKKENDNDDLVYIFNPYQAEYYISKGLQVKKIGVHYTTRKPFYCFVREETIEPFREWCESSPKK